MKRVCIKIPFDYLVEPKHDETGAGTPAKLCPYFMEGNTFMLERMGVMPKGFCPKAWRGISGAVNAIASGSSFMSWNNHDGTSIMCCPEEDCPVLFEILAQ